jgi:hypothetical protein
MTDARRQTAGASRLPSDFEHDWEAARSPSHAKPRRISANEPGAPRWPECTHMATSPFWLPPVQWGPDTRHPTPDSRQPTSDAPRNRHSAEIWRCSGGAADGACGFWRSSNGISQKVGDFHLAHNSAKSQRKCPRYGATASQHSSMLARQHASTPARQHASVAHAGTAANHSATTHNA